MTTPYNAADHIMENMIQEISEHNNLEVNTKLDEVSSTAGWAMTCIRKLQREHVSAES